MLDRIVEVDVGGRWVEAHGLQTCAIQVPPLVVPGLFERTSCPETVRLLEALLDPTVPPGEGLLDDLTGAGPRLLVLPELALGPEDWGRVHAAVSAWPEPLLLLCGAGFFTGEWLRAWADGSPARIPGWRTTPRRGVLYNGGWVWVHRPGDTRCVTFLKNFLQQRDEATAGVPVEPGREILRVETGDLTIFPLICADLVCSHDDGPRERVRASLRSRAPAGGRALVVGMLAEHQPWNPKWYEALVFATAGTSEVSPNLLIVNRADRGAQPDPARDRWRNLTGVFVHSHDFHAVPRPQPGVRLVNEGPVSGLVFRTRDPGLLGGRMAWRLGSSLGILPFTGARFAPLRKDGRPGTPDPLLPAPFEVARYLERHPPGSRGGGSPAPELPSPGTRLQDEVARLPADVAMSICQQVMDGPIPGSTLSVDDLDALPHGPDLASGLGHLAIMAAGADLPVKTGAAEPGQLRLPTAPGDPRPGWLLVWHNHELHGPQIRGRLKQWLSEAGEPTRLAVLAHSRSPFRETDLRLHLTDPRPGRVREFTDPLDRVVHLRSAEALEALLAPPDPDEPGPPPGSLQTRLHALLSPVNPPAGGGSDDPTP